MKINNNLKYEECPMCKSSAISKKGMIQYRGAPLYYSTMEIELLEEPELWECSMCGGWFTQNIIKEKDSIDLYSKGVSTERWAKVSFINTLSFDGKKVIKKYFKKGISLLDIGCGAGALLDHAKYCGCLTSGVEYSKVTRENLKFNHKVYSSLEEVKDTFDVITAFSLVEHIYDFDKFLDDCKARLNKNGVLIFYTGNNACERAKDLKEKWWYVGAPEHIIFPSKESYVRNGFVLKEYCKTPSKLPTFTFKGILRKSISLFTSKRNLWPFYPHDHYLIALGK